MQGDENAQGVVVQERLPVLVVKEEFLRHEPRPG